MKSLLIVGLPRSLTSKSYKIASTCLLHELKESGANAGEILNYYPIPPEGPVPDEKIFYTKNKEDIKEMAKYAVRFSTSRIVKDVVQPYAVKHIRSYYKDRFNILWIDRMLQDVVYSMINRNWWYPLRNIDLDLFSKAEALREGDQVSDTIITGMLGSMKDAREIYQGLPKISYWNILHETDTIPEALRGMGYSPNPFNYITEGFRRTRAEKLNARNTQLWHRINAMYRTLSSR
jgi:hypothetical protein